MATDRELASAEQVKALANPVRLRILRRCHQRDHTNQELADWLDLDPSTAHYHVRILCNAGFLEPAELRQSDRGPLEKPYRSTGLSWTLDLGGGADANLAALDALRSELLEAGADSGDGSSRFILHLSDEDHVEVLGRIQEVLDSYAATDDERRLAGHPARGGLFMLHRLAEIADD